MPFLQAPYRNAYYISIVRDAVREGRNLPVAHLAHTFGRWDCTEDVDRLNSLFGLAYRHNRDSAIMRPSSALSPAAFYHRFTLESIRKSGDLSILHFAGLSGVLIPDDEIRIQVQDLADDLPLWVSDWRSKYRPLHSLKLPGNAQPYDCTSTIADFAFIDDKYQPNSSPALLEVSAIKIDSVKQPLPVYLPTFGDHGDPSFAQWISIWYEEVQKHLPSRNINEAFSSTLIMEGRLKLIERPDLSMSSDQAALRFKRLKARHFKTFTEPSGDDIEAAFEDALCFVAYAEEVCRYRSLFITQKGRLGLGSAYVPEGSSIYAIHGLKTPFVVDQRRGPAILRGECYLNEVMDMGLSRSSEDVRLRLS